MGKVIVDLASCSGTEQPYVMVSQCTSLDGLLILRDFNKSKITRRVSEDLRREYGRLNLLKLKTIMKYGSGEEVVRAKEEVEEIESDGKWKKERDQRVREKEKPKKER